MRSLRALVASSVGVGSIIAAGISGSALAQDAVQWRIEDGGNGHWYAVHERPYGTYNWNETRALVQSVGADLATFQTMSEWLFFRAITQQYEFTQYLSGGTRAAGPQSQWMWLDGTPFSYTAWASGVPNNGTGIDLVLTVGKGLTGPSGIDGWDDWRVVDFSNGYTLEWSADCNSDGIVDYGQIRAGDLANTNANNIPDCCEASEGCNPCLADIDESGAVNAVDLAAILSNWGTNGGKYPRADIDGNGDIDGADLAAVLSAWGPCP
jgi:hypothetical protein